MVCMDAITDWWGRRGRRERREGGAEQNGGRGEQMDRGGGGREEGRQPARRQGGSVGQGRVGRRAAVGFSSFAVILCHMRPPGEVLAGTTSESTCCNHHATRVVVL